MEELKNDTVENQSSPTVDNNYEFNSYYVTGSGISDLLFSTGIYDFFSKEEIDSVVRNPIANYSSAIRLSEFCYSKSGIISNAIDYLVGLLTLDGLPITKGKTAKDRTNKETLSEILDKVSYKDFVRDAMFTLCLHGVCFYYLETTNRKSSASKYMTDYDIGRITELNESDGLNVDIITLPWEYTKIVGIKNSRYVLAFNLRYFDDYVGDTLERKLRKYPKELREAYMERKNNTDARDWYILDQDHTICCKIKARKSEPWGRGLIVSALSDLLDKDNFNATKKNLLDNVNNQIIYQVFPENKQGTGCTLTGKQQQAQHDTVRTAILNKNNKNGTSVFSLAAGTKLDSIKPDTSLYQNAKDEAESLNQSIFLDVGVAGSLLGSSSSSGSYASNSQNLELLTSQAYGFANSVIKELVACINKCIIKDSKHEPSLYLFPTSFVNRKEFFDMCLSAYTTCGGSVSFVLASMGITPDIYINTVKEEYDNGVYELLKPHATSFTTSGNEDDKGGRPEEDSNNENTLKSKANNANDLPDRN